MRQDEASWLTTGLHTTRKAYFHNKVLFSPPPPLPTPASSSSSSSDDDDVDDDDDDDDYSPFLTSPFALHETPRFRTSSFKGTILYVS